MSLRIGHFRWPLAVAAAIVICLYAFSPNFRYSSGPQASPYGGDFLQEWLGGWVVRSGDHTRFYDRGYVYQLQHDRRLVGFAWNDDEYLPLVYPPFYYLLVSPLSYLPFHLATWAWAAGMLATLVASLWLLGNWLATNARLAHAREKWQAGAPWLLPVAVLFVPVLESLSSSQKGTLCLLILAATFVLWDRRRPFWAGVVFGLLAFKPQLTLVIAVAALCKRQWRFVAGGMLTGALLAALSLAVGADVCRQYVQFATGAGDYMQTSGYDLHKSHSIWGFFALLGGPHSHGFGGWAAPAAAALVWAVVAKSLWEPLVPSTTRFRLQFATLVIASVLLSPHLFTYDLTILLLPMSIVLQTSVGERNRPAIRGLLWLVVLLWAIPSVSTGIAAATGVQVSVPLLLALLFAAGSAINTCRDDAVGPAARYAAPPSGMGV